VQPSSTNGHPKSARETLDAVRQLVEKLEGDLQKQQEEIKQLRAERDEYRAIVYDSLKKHFNPKDWDDFDEKDYKYTLDDILADIREK
jgi:hypothetical protein